MQTASSHEMVRIIADLAHEWPWIHQVQPHCEETEAQGWQKFAPGPTAGQQNLGHSSLMW